MAAGAIGEPRDNAGWIARRDIGDSTDDSGGTQRDNRVARTGL